MQSSKNDGRSTGSAPSAASTRPRRACCCSRTTAASRRLLVAAGTCRKTYVLDVAGDVTDGALASLARPLDDVTLHTREAVRTASADVAVLRRAATAVFEAASVLSFNRPRVDGVALGPRRVDGVRGAVKPATRRWRHPTTTQATLEVTIAEGRNRQIRRLAARADPSDRAPTRAARPAGPRRPARRRRAGPDAARGRRAPRRRGPRRRRGRRARCPAPPRPN